MGGNHQPYFRCSAGVCWSGQCRSKPPESLVTAGFLHWRNPVESSPLKALFPSWSYVTRSLQATSEDCNIQRTPLSTRYRPEVKLLLGSTAADTHLLGSRVMSSRPYSPVRWLDTCSFSKQTPRLWSSFRETFSCQDLGNTQC